MRRHPLTPLRIPVGQALLILWLVCPRAQAQLTELSRGDTDQKWREAQIASLGRQLSDSEIQGPLRDELKAQGQWLSAWQPGQLTDQPLWTSKRRSKKLTEPTIDPMGVARAIREKLFGPGARPTVDHTQQLEKLLQEHPGDVGVCQLHLQWLDQRQYRKRYPDEIADAAMRVYGLLDQLAPQNDEIRTAKAYCLYRRGRALAYRELPDVLRNKPLEDPQQHAATLLGAYNQLVELAGKGRPEFILLEIRMLRRDRWYGQALVLLESYAQDVDRQWFLKKRRDLLKELGWNLPGQEAAAIYAEAFPDAVAEEQKAG